MRLKQHLEEILNRQVRDCSLFIDPSSQVFKNILIYKYEKAVCLQQQTLSLQAVISILYTFSS